MFRIGTMLPNYTRNAVLFENRQRGPEHYGVNESSDDF